MKQIKLKKIVALLLTAAVSLTMVPGAVWADSSTDKDFLNSKCIITDARVIGTGGIQISFKMKGNQSVKGYEIYRAATKDGEYRLIDTMESYENIYFDDNVKKGKVYYYKVRGYNSIDGKKVYSTFSDVEGKRSTTGPVSISKLKVSKSGKVTGTINKNKNADGYYIYYAAKKSGPYKLIKKVGKTKLKLNFSVPSGKSQYFFKIRGYVNVNGKKYFGTYSSVYEINKNANKIVNIPNKELKKAMGLSGTVRAKDLAKLDIVSFEDIECDDKDFTFLKYCTNLKMLVFEGCPLSSIKVICENIKNTPVFLLSLSHTKVKDLSPIVELNKLKSLDVHINGLPIANISVINQMPYLEEFGYKLEDVYFHTLYNPFYSTNYAEVKKICDNAGITYDDFMYNITAWAELEAEMDRFIREEINDSMSDYEKIKKAHDFICKKITYGKESSSGDCKHIYPYCALMEGHGVCIDYAMTFGYLTGRMGFETYCVSGYGSATLEDHAWNIIKLDGNYYHVDCTWDDKEMETSYKYFLISDKTIRSYRDYKWETDILPACPSDYMSEVE